MDKSLYRFLISSLLLILTSAVAMPAAAQTEDEEPSAPVLVAESEDIIGFDLLGFTGQILNSEVASARLTFSMPPHWQLAEGAQLELNFNTFLSAPETLANAVYGGQLAIEFNGVILDVLLLDRNGPRSVVLPIPTEALASPGGTYTLNITLLGIHSCIAEQRTNTVVFIDPSSRLALPHQVVTPTLDLKRLPYPIQQNSFLRSEAVLVVPDEPTPEELQAALTVAAGFGRMASGLQLPLLAVSELSAEQRSQAHLVVVGKLAGIPWLGEIALPAPDNAVPEATEATGVLQMALSPWNDGRVVLLISGNNDVGVVMAAQAVASGVIRTTERADLAVVTEVDPILTTVAPQATERTLVELGYGQQIIQGGGVSRFEIEFAVAPGQTLANEDDGRFNLIFNHSALLSYDRSGIVVRLNNEPIDSIRLDGESTRIVNRPILIPASGLLPGLNRLTFLIELSPLADCKAMGPESVWLNIQPTSSLHLAFSPVQEDSIVEQISLNSYPQPFTFDQSLSTTAFILPPAQPRAWASAAHIASNLGRNVNGQVLDLHAAYATDELEALPQERDWIIVGRPSTLAVIQALNDRLPGPFTPGADQVLDEKLPITYQVSPAVDLGYLEYLQAPWNQERSIIAVLGRSDAGLQSAVESLLTAGQRRKLVSDFAIVEGLEIYTPLEPAEVEEVASEPTATPAAGQVVTDTVAASGAAVEQANTTPTADTTSARPEATTAADSRTTDNRPAAPDAAAATPRGGNSVRQEAAEEVDLLPVLLIAGLSVTLVVVTLIRFRR